MRHQLAVVVWHHRGAGDDFRHDRQMRYDSDMRKPTIALLTAALAFAGFGYAALAQQKPAGSTAANKVVVYKSPT
jgi:hypothetical protein